MQSFEALRPPLELASDGEVAATLKKYFSEFGPVSSADRFFALKEAGKRYFLVQFENSTDAIKATNRYKLRSFAFNGVLVELGCAAEEQG